MAGLYLTNTGHCAAAIEDREKAWHILAILLSIGRPVHPEELALRCEFLGVSPDFIQFLCTLPSSPLILMDTGLVTASTSAAFQMGRSISCLKRFWDSNVKTYSRKRKGSVVDSVLWSVSKRRRSLPFGNGEGSRSLLLDTNGSQCTFPQEFAIPVIRNMNFLPVDLLSSEWSSQFLNEESAATPLLLHSNTGKSFFSIKEVDHVDGKDERDNCKGLMISRHTSEGLNSSFSTGTNPNIPKLIQKENFLACNSGMASALLMSRFGNTLSCEEAHHAKLRNESGVAATFCLKVDKHTALPVEAGMSCIHACEDSMNQLVEDAKTHMDIKEGGSVNSGTYREEQKNLGVVNSTKYDQELLKDTKLQNPINIEKMEREQSKQVEDHGMSPSDEDFSAEEHPKKSFVNQKAGQKTVLPSQSQVLLEWNSPRLSDQCNVSQKVIPMRQKIKQSHKKNMHAKENVSVPEAMLEKKKIPHFESFVIEEEEGSGGYGTVYKALRKDNGKRVALKCPHVNSQTHYVYNELKMLERFGGKNFIIKYEGSFKSKTGECFVLEHVDHDRPEVLKREIDVFQLQWYGYCLFKALAYLHKQGVAHRDVKPGNFLFSRKLNKGYLIDFNLALDLQRKYASGSKSRSSFDHVPLPLSKTSPSTKDKKSMRGKLEDVIVSKATLEPKNMKKKANADSLKTYPDTGGRNMFRNQGGDGSGITSTKDMTSTRTPSAERLREPVPSLGRKELISLAQHAMQVPNQDTVSIPAGQRKRVAAPGNADERIVYLSPMPLHSMGVSVAGAGLIKSKGDGKHKKEGPCVGTKGFRAPEVLFRSQHQGCKVDIWSAGVTLLYLMVGKSPFVGDPEQNIKDIMKLRGSEDLWEVAKLHNRESSFPGELFDTRYLSSVELRQWCKHNTKRPEFFKLIPRSLFDLVDKCLTVNPRQRLSAEEALRHEFFSSCHESLRKQRMLRQEGHRLESLDNQSVHLEHGNSQLS